MNELKQKDIMMYAKKVYRAIFPMRIYNYPFFLQDKFVKRLAELAKGKSVLDAGAGECPFKYLFSQSTYLAQDIGGMDSGFDYSKIDIVSDIYQIPQASNSYDFILCSEVLEHLQYPQKAVSEFARLIKPGGQVWITVPFSGGLHQEPHDYYRYTKYALQGFAKDAGLKVKELIPLGGAFIYLGLVIKNLSSNFVESRVAYTLWSCLLFPIVLIVTPFLVVLDQMDTVQKLTPGYLVIYEK